MPSSGLHTFVERLDGFNFASTDYRRSLEWRRQARQMIAAGSSGMADRRSLAEYFLAIAPQFYSSKPWQAHPIRFSLVI